MKTARTLFSTLSRRLITSAANSHGKFLTDISAYSNVTHGVTPLNSYGVIKISGKDCTSFLQGLVTNDIINRDTISSYNAILSPNGRYLYDCFVTSMDLNKNEYLIETDKNTIPQILKYFKKYKLRSKVKFEDKSDEYRVWSILTSPKSIKSTFESINNKNEQRICYIDPRYDGLGIRVILNKNEIPHFISDNFVPIGEDFYNSLKCIYGIPTNSIDLISDKTIILESNLSYLNGISFTKGCYVGQELIARTHFRGQIRKRLFGATIINDNNDNNNNDVINIDNNKDDNDRDTIIPTDIINNIDDDIKDIDFSNKNIVDINNDKVVGKIISKESVINCCIAQLRNSAFADINVKNNPKTVGLKIEKTDYKIIPHFIDYFPSFSELFAAKE